MGAIWSVPDAGLGSFVEEFGELDWRRDDRQPLQGVLSTFRNVDIEISVLPFLEVVSEHIRIDNPHAT